MDNWSPDVSSLLPDLFNRQLCYFIISLIFPKNDESIIVHRILCPSSLPLSLFYQTINLILSIIALSPPSNKNQRVNRESTILASPNGNQWTPSPSTSSLSLNRHNWLWYYTMFNIHILCPINITDESFPPSTEPFPFATRPLLPLVID